jgi:hypothetical protein
MPTITRIAPGFYDVTYGDRTVEIENRKDVGGWVARATWSRNEYSDPLRTYAEAKQWAIETLSE